MIREVYVCEECTAQTERPEGWVELEGCSLNGSATKLNATSLHWCPGCAFRVLASTGIYGRLTRMPAAEREAIEKAAQLAGDRSTLRGDVERCAACAVAYATQGHARCAPHEARAEALDAQDPRT